MSLVVFPFKEEDSDVVARNLTLAATHERATEVWAVGAADNVATDRIAAVARDIQQHHSTPIRVFAQARLGRFRPGKGDGMNTAIREAAERGFERVHFYDADITNFDHSWIDGAELPADRGFGVVRHRFPRAATDAMITWMITRPGLATIFPGTILPRLGQPLGGELLLTRPAVEALAGDPGVVERSDWGVDTLITHRTAALGLDIYEHNAPDGKRHALYGSLTDIEDMVLECLDAVRSLLNAHPPTGEFKADPAAEVPEDLKEVVGYNTSATRSEIDNAPDPSELVILQHLGVSGSEDIDARAWMSVFPGLLADFQLHDPSWRKAAFRVWALRVLGYTENVVPLGYDTAIRHLEETIRDFETEADEHG